MLKRLFVVTAAMLIAVSPLAARQAKPVAPNPLIGKKVPAILVNDFAGKSSKITAHLGKPTFVSFWASWCGPCLKEMPELNALLDKHKGEFQVLAIATGDKLSAAEPVMKARAQFNFQWFIDPAGVGTMDSELATSFKIIALPTAMWVAADGTIVDYWRGLPPGEGELTRKVEGLLAKGK